MQHFSTVMELRNFLLAHPDNRARDRDGDVIRAYSDDRTVHYLMENGEEIRDMSTKNYGPWTEILDEEPRFQEPGPEDLHYNPEPISFTNMTEMLLWLIIHPGRKVDDKHSLYIYFASDDDGFCAFRYGSGQMLAVNPNNGPWTVIHEKDSVLRDRADQLMQSLCLSKDADRIKIMDFLRSIQSH